MKKIIIGLLLFCISFGFVSCIKNDEVTFTEPLVEFDAAVLNANSAYMLPPDSIAFPMLTRKPAIGRPVATADLPLGRSSGSVQLRVNLLGGVRKQATDINYRVVNINEYKLLGVLSNTNEQAAPGTHYAALPGKVTIPADSSFGYINVEVLNPGTPNLVSRELVLMLTDGNDVRASRNYKVVGLRIGQQ